MVNRYDSMSRSHRDALIDLVQFKQPLAELRASILAQVHDYDGEPVVLTRKDLTSVLRRCIDREIPGVDITAWAELVEGRPGIDYESEKEEELSEVLFELSTPEINEAVTPEKCWRLLKALR